MITDTTASIGLPAPEGPAGAEHTSGDVADVPVPPAVAARALLDPYPHVAACRPCHEYAAAYLPGLTPSDVLVATLAHHDSGHRFDLVAGSGPSFGGQF